MKSLGFRQVLWIHRRVIEETGGSYELRDEGLLRSALARPHASFGGQDLYPTLYEKAAAIFDSLLRSHPFVDGNKRVAWECLDIMMELNGRHMTATQEQAFNLIRKIIGHQMTVQDVADWLEKHNRPYRGRR